MSLSLVYPGADWEDPKDVFKTSNPKKEMHPKDVFRMSSCSFDYPGLPVRITDRSNRFLELFLPQVVL